MDCTKMGRTASSKSTGTATGLLKAMLKSHTRTHRLLAFIAIQSAISERNLTTSYQIRFSSGKLIFVSIASISNAATD